MRIAYRDPMTDRFTAQEEEIAANAAIRQSRTRIALMNDAERRANSIEASRGMWTVYAPTELSPEEREAWIERRVAAKIEQLDREQAEFESSLPY